MNKTKVYINPFQNRGYKNIKNILVIRSARMWQFNKAINLLNQEFNQAKISVLIQPIVKTKIEAPEKINEIIIYDKSKFDLYSFGIKSIKEIRDRNYDLIVVLYNNLAGMTYLQLDLIALLCKSKYTVALDTSAQCHEINLFYWIVSLFNRSAWISFPFKLIINLLDIILYILSTLFFLPFILPYIFYNKLSSIWKKS